MTALPEPESLLSAVQSVLDHSGILGIRRVLWHPGRPGSVAVRGEFLECYAAELERAGFEVEDCGGWLTVSERPATSAAS